MEDYRKWPDDKCWEIIDGEPFMMNSPGLSHQNTLLNLAVELKSFFKGKLCEVIPISINSFIRYISCFRSV
ncbi:MAG: Uma2 family endonuclease [Candidatus Riflebacteria bacterium]|nr:Uma2 family endonuclease [Candidatus Riflebacteria bacterium]